MQFHVEAREEDEISLLRESSRMSPVSDIWAATYRLTAFWMMKFTIDLDNPQQLLGVSNRRVFSNHDLSLATRVMVYNAVCVSSLLYCSESWTRY